MAHRRHDIDDAVTIRVDGEEIRGQRGEPLAATLLASGRQVFGRSVKYHRPRGPFCLAGRCDGCLMRVDGRPNVMTCSCAVESGMEVETQNVVGSADHDLLAATDWFFPGGIDHHHMFTRFGAVNRAMQKVARRLAGIGELPDRPMATRPMERRQTDVLVIGGGVVGCAVATLAAGEGLSTVLVEERPTLGGVVADYPGRVGHGGQDTPGMTLATAMGDQASGAGVTVLTAHTAVAIYGHVAIAATQNGLVAIECRRLVVASGCHEVPLPSTGNDLPGVFGVRAAARLLAQGVVPGQRVLIMGEDEPWATAMAEALRAEDVVVFGPVGAADVTAIRGRRAVSGADVRGGATTKSTKATERLRIDAVLHAGPASAVFELARQTGAQVSFRDGGFVVAVDDHGRSDVAGVYAAGECTGPASITEHLGQAARIAACLAQDGGEIAKAGVDGIADLARGEP